MFKKHLSKNERQEIYMPLTVHTLTKKKKSLNIAPFFYKTPFYQEDQ